MAFRDGDESKPRAEPVDPGSAVAPASSNALGPGAPGPWPVDPVPKSVLLKRNAARHIDSDSMSQSSVGTSVSRAVSVQELQDKADRVRMDKRVEQARYILRMLESEREEKRIESQIRGKIASSEKSNSRPNSEIHSDICSEMH